MNYLVAYLPDAYLHEIADYFAKLRPPFAAHEPVTADQPTLARGQSLVQHGDPKTGVPACVACHGARLTGMDPGIPGLAGLRSTYIAAQLTRWKVGERNATPPDCMKRIATRLTNADIAAVSAWLARQPAPQDQSPDSPDYVRMPFACGSQERR
jgi:cytochrome c553